MRHARIVRPRGAILFCVGLVCLVSATGCTHNHYYGYNPCAPGTTTILPSGGAAGPVCDVPAVGNSSVVAGRPASDPVIVSSSRPPRVVVSQPGSRSGLSWRSADPDGGTMTTRVDGAVDSQSVTR